MPFVSGHKNAGRPKGSKNKGTLELEAKMKRLGVDPFEVLLLFAGGCWQKLGYASEMMEIKNKDYSNYEYTIDPQVRSKAAAEACQYLFPKRKAVELDIQNADEARQAVRDEIQKLKEKQIKLEKI